jgi:DNA (cytosine-5)-methyltransferase 1
MAALLAALVDLGYGVSWRTLDARYSGVPQRRRRVFILGVRMRDDDPDGHLAAERAAEILALTASRCGHSAKSGPEGPGSAPTPRTGIEIAGGLTRRYGKGVNTTLDDGALVVGEAAESGGDREADGTAGWLDDREGLERTYSIVPEGGQGADLRASEVETSPSVTTEDAKQSDRGVRVAYIKKTRPHGPDGDGERWDTDDVSPTLNQFDAGDSRAVTLIAPTVNSNKGGGWRMDADQAESLVIGGSGDDDPLLPPRLDSNRYRACGNAVVVNVAEWLGRRIMLAVEGKI